MSETVSIPLVLEWMSRAEKARRGQGHTDAALLWADAQKAVLQLERDNAALRADAEKWRGLALLDPMDIATVICGAPTAKKMLDDLSRRIDAAKEKA